MKTKIARRLFNNFSPAASVTTFERLSPENAEEWIDRAEEVLELMRRPTDALLSAGVAAYEQTPDDEDSVAAMGNAWVAMIAEAMKEAGQ